MTFEELNQKLGGNENASDWSQHTNGGGWIHKNAKVAASAFIGDNAIIWGQVSGNAHVYGDAWVYGDAHVYGDARVYDDARVYGNAWVSGDAHVSGNAWVYGDARVYGNAWVYGDARVSGNAWVYGDARVSGNAWATSPLFIVGSRHSLTNAKAGYIQIGCQCETFAWWLSKEGEAVARENDYTDAEIAEYRAYVELFSKVGR